MQPYVTIVETLKARDIWRCEELGVAMIEVFETSICGVRRHLANLGVAFLLLAAPASAASPEGVGMSAVCKELAPLSGTLECAFPLLPPDKGLEIQYISAYCTINPASPAAVWGFQIMTIPPNAVGEVPYQIPVPSNLNTLSTFAGFPTAVWSAGEPATLYAKAGSNPRALLYMGNYATTPGLNCRVSLSGKTF